MSTTRLRAQALFFTALVMAVAACESATSPLPSGADFSPRTTLGPATGTEATDCPSIGTGDVAINALAVPPVPSEPVGSHGEEEELNEGDPPPIPVDPDAVVADRSLFDPSAIPPRGSQGDPQPDDLVLFGGSATSLKTGYTYQTAEPEAAMKGQRVLLTWNAMAARSTDGGATFQYLPPQTSFPRADGGFCCDQRSLHVPRQDLWLWVLQYESGPDENNTIRLAWAVGDDDFDAARFKYVDWRAVDVGFDEGTFFDQPKLGISDEHFFLSINAFRERSFVGAVVMRGSLQDMVDGNPPATSCLVAEDPRTDERLFGPYPVRDADDTMYLAAHVSTSELGVWSWPDSAAAPTFASVIGRDAAGQPVAYPLERPYTCEREGAGPTSDWCFRPVRGEPNRSANDARITSGWHASGTIGFAWNASQNANFEYPFVWAVTLDATRLDACEAGECVLGYPIIFSDNVAFQYGALAGNGRGDLGGVVLLGGGEQYLGCAVVAREAGTTGGWDLTRVATSPADMPTPNSGDYLGIAADGEAANGWSGSCMTYDPALSESGGGTVIHFMRFGRRSDEP
jgi:hypothetical protein